jgi:hypothetical protein
MLEIQRLAHTMCEDIQVDPQSLLDSFVEQNEVVNYRLFREYCEQCDITLTEQEFMQLLANNTSYLFTECNGTWLPTAIKSAQLDEVF